MFSLKNIENDCNESHSRSELQMSLVEWPWCSLKLCTYSADIFISRVDEGRPAGKLLTRWLIGIDTGLHSFCHAVFIAMRDSGRVRAGRYISCDMHAHLVSKAGSWLAVNLHHLFSNGAAFNTRSRRSRTSDAISRSYRRRFICDNESDFAWLAWMLDFRTREDL